MNKSFFICLMVLLTPLKVASEECSFAPTARITTTPVSGSSPDFVFRDGTEVVFSGATSTANNCNGSITEYRWKIEGVYYYGSTKTYTFPALGASEHKKTYSVELRVRNDASPNLYNTKTITVTVKRPQRIYHLKDHLGNVRTSVDTEGNVVGYDDYYPFGLSMPGRSNNTANPNDNYKFIGEELDDEAGLTLMNLNARTYDPITGRFNQIDPLFDHPNQIGLSPYNYSWNNPMNLSDPTGECPWCPPAVAGGTGLAATGAAIGAAIGATAAYLVIDEIQDNQGYFEHVGSAIKEQVSGVWDSAKSLFSSDAKVTGDVATDATSESPSESTTIYRMGSGTPQSLTPRDNDVTGLSFSTVKPTAGKYVETTLGAVNSTGQLKALIDNPSTGHVSVSPIEYPVDNTRMQSWINSRPTANQSPHPLTQTLQGITTIKKN